MKFNKTKITALILFGLIILFVGYLVSNADNEPEEMIIEPLEETKIDEKLHPSGLIEAEGVTQVVNNCTQCHSTAIISQNRLNEEGWRQLIIWMQETQNLWDLGDNEQIIIDYLVANYPPLQKGRRANLADVEWYELNK